MEWRILVKYEKVIIPSVKKVKVDITDLSAYKGKMSSQNSRPSRHTHVHTNITASHQCGILKSTW